MKSVSTLIQSRRTALGLTQQECAYRSKISIATLQNLEAGKGNPSLEILSLLFSTLGLSLSIHPEPTRWELLATLGAPISPSPQGSKPLRPTPELLVNCLPAACADLTKNARQTEALQGLILALKLHYPSFFEENFRHISSIQNLVSLKPLAWSGKLIHLKRQALPILGTYL